MTNVVNQHITDNFAEEWRPYRSGEYEVSNHGRVRRAKPSAWFKKHKEKYPQDKKLTLGKIGYFVFQHYVNGNGELVYVHRLVAECFLGESPDGAEVNHKDGNKQNNFITNLEYVSHHRNMTHANEIGLANKHKTSQEIVDKARILLQSGKKQYEIARILGVSNSTISKIHRGLL